MERLDCLIDRGQYIRVCGAVKPWGCVRPYAIGCSLCQYSRRHLRKELKTGGVYQFMLEGNRNGNVK